MILERLNTILSKGSSKDWLSKSYDIIMLICILVSIIPLMFSYELSFFKPLEIITVSVFILDYIARWITASIRLKKGWISFLIYPFTPMAIIDLLSIIPAFNVIGNSFKLLRLTRFFRLIRVFRAVRYSNRIEMLGRVLYKERRVLLSVLLIAVFYIFVTALIMYNVEPHINTETGQPTFSTFFDALYWAAVTLTTVGYGDIVPVTAAGRLISILSSLFGVAVIALPSGVITAGYLEELKKEKEDAKNDNVTQ